MKTLKARLNAACVRHGLEWVVLPCEEPGPSGYQSRDAWRKGPYWCALVKPGPRSSGHGSFYAYNGLIKGRENDPDPDVVFIHPGPLGRRAAKRLLLAELGE